MKRLPLTILLVILLTSLGVACSSTHVPVSIQTTLPASAGTASTPTSSPTASPTVTPPPTATQTPTPLPTPTIIGGFVGKYFIREGNDLNLYEASGNKLRTLFKYPDFNDDWSKFSKLYPSPDGGNFIIEYLGETGSTQGTILKLINIKTENATVLQEFPGQAGGVEKADWSPDGKFFAVMGEKDNFYGEADGSNIQKIDAQCAKYFGPPKFLKDGQSIAFLSGNGPICIYNIKDKTTRRVNTYLGASYHSYISNVSHDGKVIVNSDTIGYSNNWIIDLNTGDNTKISLKPDQKDFKEILNLYNTGTPGISPDGRWFYVLRYGYGKNSKPYPQDPNLDSYLITAPIDNPKQGVLIGVIARPVNSYTTWSPDGNWIVFDGKPLQKDGSYGERGFYAIKPDGTELTPLDSLDAVKTNKLAQPIVFGLWRP